jgi:hypothetical protein
VLDIPGRWGRMDASGLGKLDIGDVHSDLPLAL